MKGADKNRTLKSDRLNACVQFLEPGIESLKSDCVNILHWLRGQRGRKTYPVAELREHIEEISLKITMVFLLLFCFTPKYDLVCGLFHSQIKGDSWMPQ